MLEKDIKQEATDYLSDLLNDEKEKSPEMVIAIAGLLKVILDA